MLSVSIAVIFYLCRSCSKILIIYKKRAFNFYEKLKALFTQKYDCDSIYLYFYQSRFISTLWQRFGLSFEKEIFLFPHVFSPYLSLQFEGVVVLLKRILSFLIVCFLFQLIDIVYINVSMISCWLYKHLLSITIDIPSMIIRNHVKRDTQEIQNSFQYQINLTYS